MFQNVIMSTNGYLHFLAVCMEMQKKSPLEMVCVCEDSGESEETGETTITTDPDEIEKFINSNLKEWIRAHLKNVKRSGTKRAPKKGKKDAEENDAEMDPADDISGES